MPPPWPIASPGSGPCPSHHPGEVLSYANTGFRLAGAVIKTVIQTRCEAAMRERVFARPGLLHPLYFAHEAITYPVAVGREQARRPRPTPAAALDHVAHR
jgi:CubicO group peptidase (beta-lactamase class C family)